jgi:GTP pyrophosphokinase
MPKFNLYQSLHTTVIGPGGKVVEMQIRTREMHHRAEWGVAAHWAYKDDESSGSDIDWLNRIIDWQADVTDPAAFMENLKTDLEQDEVFVFTPKGNVITLPVGATTVDFAYAVHSEVGHRCMGAKVNGRLVPLPHVVKSGDTCEIFTNKSETAAPSRDWLQFVVSPRARNKIKHWFSRERRDDMIESGREALAKEFRRLRLPVRRIWTSDAVREEVEAASYADLDSLLAAIGEGHVVARSIAQKVARSFRSGADAEQLPATILDHERSSGPRRPRNLAGVHVEGLDDVLVRLSRCCTPVPGDDIVGFVTRGRGVSVHRTDCANAESLMNEQAARLLDVEWDGDRSKAMFRVAVEVVAFDRPGLLRDVAKSLSEQHVNIVSSSTKTGSDRLAKMKFEFELGDPAHLDMLLRVIKQIESVYDAYRLVQGKGS